MHDLHANGIAAGERHLGDARVCRQRSANGQAGAAHKVKDTRRHTGFSDDRGQLQFRQRRHFRRLEHHAATGGQGRGEFPRGGDHRKIPRHDQADHTARLAAQASAEVVGRQLYRAVLFGIQAFGQTGVILERGDHVIDVDRGFELRLAVVARLQVHQLFTIGLHARGDFAQDRTAFGARGFRPVGERLGRRAHGLINRAFVAAIDGGQQGFGRRVDHPQVFVAGRPLAVDVQAIQSRREAHFDTACIHWVWSISIRVGPWRSVATRNAPRNCSTLLTASAAQPNALATPMKSGV
ncbi:hypothetical protein D9M69_493110 [compost metagenome]